MCSPQLYFTGSNQTDCEDHICTAVIKFGNVSYSSIQSEEIQLVSLSPTSIILFFHYIVLYLNSLFFCSKGSEILYKNVINKALDYIARSISPDMDAYSLALAGSALANAKHPQATQALQMMDKYANATGKSSFIRYSFFLISHYFSF